MVEEASEEEEETAQRHRKGGHAGKPSFFILLAERYELML